MRIYLLGFICLLLASCGGKKLPDVSGIKVPLEVKRFENDFFQLDSINMNQGLQKLAGNYAGFYDNFMVDILGIDDGTNLDSVAVFSRDFALFSQSIYDTAKIVFKDFEPYKKEIERASKYVAYYFPKYKLPQQIITYIGPANGFADVLGKNTFIVGLQAHLGENYSLYKTDFVQSVYPTYITKRFTPEYIAVNSLRNVVNDLYPNETEDKRLINVMIENGKKIWLLEQFLPEKKPNTLIGYTENQYKECMENQPAIWSFFTQNNLLQIQEANAIKNYVSEGPKTPELGEAAPGNIGSFVGWQIVRKYAAAHTELLPDAIMQTNNEVVFKEVKYKP
jgi:hypothetical protein